MRKIVVNIKEWSNTYENTYTLVGQSFAKIVYITT